MGNFKEGLTARIRHTKISKGYCLICGALGPLSIDHVPPKCCVTITRVEQRHVTDSLNLHDRNIKGVPSTNGSKFKTICQGCNSRLGRTDILIGEAYKQLTKQVVRYYSEAQLLPKASVPINPIGFARSMIGHILAATSVRECDNPPISASFFDPLKGFVLGDDNAIEDTHDIYYWFYPNNVHISAKLVSFYNEGHSSLVSLLSFFPVAFMVTKKREGSYPAQARKLRFTDEQLSLDLSSRNAHNCTFPFVALSGNQMFGLDECQAIISYPAGQ